MINIVLFEPEIPPNTGNIIRLCANTGIQLHLIKPFAFELDDKRMRRAGLDYHEWAKVKIHNDYQEFLENEQPKQLWGLSTKGKTYYHKHKYTADDFFIFGPETRGLPDSILEHLKDNLLRIPMKANSRSLNLSNTVAIVAYGVLQQHNFRDLL